MSDHLVNSWENILLSSVDGDPIVALTWLHNGVKLALHVEMVMLTEQAVPEIACEVTRGQERSDVNSPFCLSSV